MFSIDDCLQGRNLFELCDELVERKGVGPTAAGIVEPVADHGIDERLTGGREIIDMQKISSRPAAARQSDRLTFVNSIDVRSDKVRRRVLEWFRVDRRHPKNT